MTNFMQKSAQHFLVIKAARRIRQDIIEKAGLDNLKILAESSVSIVGTYLNGCSPQEKATYRRDLNVLLQMGVTADMLLDELAGQMPEIAPIMKNKVDYRKSEIEKVMSFVKEG